jgi:hypothetical protein
MSCLKTWPTFDDVVPIASFPSQYKWKRWKESGMNLVSLEEGRLDVKYETLNKIGKVVSKPRNSTPPGLSIAGTNFLSTLCPPSINRFSKRSNASLCLLVKCAPSVPDAVRSSRKVVIEPVRYFGSPLFIQPPTSRWGLAQWLVLLLCRQTHRLLQLYSSYTQS